MSIEYNWKVEQLEVVPQQEGKENVVVTVHWRVIGEEVVEDKTFYGSVYSSTSLTLNIEGEFTPFENLTEEQVIGWIQGSGVDKTATEESIFKQIEDQKNPPIIKPILPWNK